MKALNTFVSFLLSLMFLSFYQCHWLLTVYFSVMGLSERMKVVGLETAMFDCGMEGLIEPGGEQVNFLIPYSFQSLLWFIARETC